jgi:fimbrial chaperone protein
MPISLCVRCAAAIAFAITAVLAAPPSRAASIEVTPIRIELGADQRSATVQIRNTGPEPVVVQSEVLEWSQPDGQDRYAPTRDVLVTPTVTTVPARSEQIVRVALRRELPATHEAAYRLYVEEIPPAARPGRVALNVALRIGIPMFVAPTAGPSAPKLAWRVRANGKSGTVLSVENAGTASMRLSEIALVGRDGKSLASLPELAYVLPGRARAWTLPAAVPSAYAAPLRIRALSNVGPLDEPVALE